MELESIKLLEEGKNNILTFEEAEWRLKSKSLWVVEGDANMKFFHAYAKHQNDVKKFWELQNEDDFKMSFFFFFQN